MRLVELSDDSRIWIYQCNRLLNEQEEVEIAHHLGNFIDDWSSHGKTMEAAGEILHHRFLIIAADENKALASGCGIDKSVNFLKRMEEEFQLNFFDRTQVAFLENGVMKDLPLNVFWAMRKAGNITDQTIVFDNTIRKIADLKSKWIVPFANSWHAEMWGR